MQNQPWSIIDNERELGPLSSYGLALWGVQGLLYPNDLLARGGEQRIKAGTLEGLQPFIRNNGHLTRAKVWSFAGGKGGVGKSMMCALFGISLGMRGKKVVIVDADFAGPNQHDIFGITREKRPYWKQLQKDIDQLVVRTAFPNLKLIYAPPTHMHNNQNLLLNKIQFIQAVRSLQADYVLVDLGPRMDFETIDYFVNADTNVLVTTPESTALQNGIAFLNSVFKRKIETAVQTLLHKNIGHFFEHVDNELPLVKQTVEILEKLSLPGEEIVRRTLASFNTKILFNMVRPGESLRPLRVMRKYLDRELGIKAEMVGDVFYDSSAHQLLRQQKLSALTHSSSTIFQDVCRLSGKMQRGAFNQPVNTVRFSNPIRKVHSKDIICGTWCGSWQDCGFKNPGSGCPVKNIN